MGSTQYQDKQTIMDNVNVLQQMSEFDFNSPMNVTMIFEDSDEDELFKNVLRGQECMKDCNKNEVSLKNRETKFSTVDKSSENLNYLEALHKSIHSKINGTKNNEKTTILEEISNKNTVKMGNDRILKETEYAKISHTSIREKYPEINNDYLSNELPVINHHYDDEPGNTFIEDLLNQLSEHLLAIIQSFYQYGRKNTCNKLVTVDIKKREKLFCFIKSHFFELSYATVESILLPQEQNISFINQFLDKTVLLAHKKHFNWKLQRHHLHPFFNELMNWVKHKRANMKQDCNQCPNKNVILKRHLSRPFYPPYSKAAPHSNYTSNSDMHKSLCIFTSGTPGNEISINVDTDTLINCTQRQYKHCPERQGYQNNNAPNNESATRNTSLTLPAHENYINNNHKNNTSYYRPPPPYPMTPNSINLNHNPNHLHPIQNYRTVAEPQQTHENIRQNKQYENQTYVQYVNTNQTPPSNSHYVNPLLQHNVNNNNQMNRMHIENQMSLQPVITNVSSLNPKAYTSRIVRCCMCGKNTSTTCSYDVPCRPSYCSNLCQELDSQIH